MEYWHMKDAAAPGAVLAELRDSGLTLLIEYFSWWRWRVDLLELLHFMAAEGRQLPATVLKVDHKGLSFVGIWVRGGDAVAHQLRPRDGASRLCSGLQCPTGDFFLWPSVFSCGRPFPVGVWSHCCGHWSLGCSGFFLSACVSLYFKFACVGAGEVVHTLFPPRHARLRM